MSIDFSVDMESDLALNAQADWQMLFLQHVPAYVALKQFNTFGEGLLGD